MIKIFGLEREREREREREQVAGVWRKVHNEVPHEFYPSQNIWTRERERESK